MLFVEVPRLTSSLRMDRLAVPALPAQALVGDVGDHLVDVHVRGGARTGLENVHLELAVELALQHAQAGGLDRVGLLRRQQSQRGIGAGAWPTSA